MKGSLSSLLLLLLSIPGCPQASYPRGTQALQESPYPLLIPSWEEAQARPPRPSADLRDGSVVWTIQRKAAASKKGAAIPEIAFNAVVELPSDWAGKQTFVFFPSVKARFEFQVNQQRVASLAQGLPGKVNLTAFLHGRSDTLTIRVNAGWNGQSVTDLIDSAFVFATAPVHLHDLALYSSCTGRHPRSMVWAVHFDQTIRNSSLENWSLDRYGFSVQLLDAEQRLVQEHRLSFSKQQPRRVGPGQQARVGTLFHDIHLRRWTAETPSLYRMVLRTRDSLNGPLGTYRERMGIRVIRQNGHGFFINQTRITFKPARYHCSNQCAAERDPIRHRRLVQAWKRVYVNTVIVSGYPPYPRLLEACDEEGLYVVYQLAPLGKALLGMDSPGKQMEQALLTVQQLKNHPCLIAWQLEGASLASQQLDSLHRLDPHRPWWTNSTETLPGEMAASPDWDALSDPEKASLQKRYQPVAFHIPNEADSTIQLANGYDFRTLAGMELQWEIRETGEKLHQGAIPEIRIGAQLTGSVRLPFAFSSFKASRYTFHFRLTPTRAVPAGTQPEYPVGEASFQFAFRRGEHVLLKR